MSNFFTNCSALEITEFVLQQVHFENFVWFKGQLKKKCTNVFNILKMKQIIENLQT